VSGAWPPKVIFHPVNRPDGRHKLFNLILYIIYIIAGMRQAHFCAARGLAYDQAAMDDVF
jgi:hypothetical protein